MTHQGSQLSTQRAPQTSSLYLADRLKPENTGYKICIGIGAGSLTHLSSGLFIHLLIVVFLSLPAELLLSSITGFHLDFSKEPRLFWPGKISPHLLKQRKTIYGSQGSGGIGSPRGL